MSELAYYFEKRIEPYLEHFDVTEEVIYKIFDALHYVEENLNRKDSLKTFYTYLINFIDALQKNEDRVLVCFFMAISLSIQPFSDYIICIDSNRENIKGALKDWKTKSDQFALWEPFRESVINGLSSIEYYEDVRNAYYRKSNALQNDCGC